MMTRPLVIVLALGLPGCTDDAPVCAEGQVRVQGRCTPYVAGDPVPRGDAWLPALRTSWQWQLTGAIDSSLDVEMYDIDLFNATDAELAALSGRIVICYFSAGTWEAWRDDAGELPDDALGDTMEDWEDERWLDVTSEGVRQVMLDRLDLAVSRGCDGVEPDNVDGYANRNGVGLNATEQLEYNRFIADAAHERGLSVGLKNDVDQLEDLLPWFDWALNEECATRRVRSVPRLHPGGEGGVPRRVHRRVVEHRGRDHRRAGLRRRTRPQHSDQDLGPGPGAARV